MCCTHVWELMSNMCSFHILFRPRPRHTAYLTPFVLPRPHQLPTEFIFLTPMCMQSPYHPHMCAPAAGVISVECIGNHVPISVHTVVSKPGTVWCFSVMPGTWSERVMFCDWFKCRTGMGQRKNNSLGFIWLKLWRLTVRAAGSREMFCVSTRWNHVVTLDENDQQSLVLMSDLSATAVLKPVNDLTLRSLCETVLSLHMKAK